MSASAGHLLVKPFVVMAARALGPGPTRVKLVRLAHQLSSSYVLVDEQTGSVQPTQRAA